MEIAKYIYAMISLVLPQSITVMPSSCRCTLVGVFKLQRSRIAENLQKWHAWKTHHTLFSYYFFEHVLGLAEVTWKHVFWVVYFKKIVRPEKKFREGQPIAENYRMMPLYQGKLSDTLGKLRPVSQCHVRARAFFGRKNQTQSILLQMMKPGALQVSVSHKE